MRNKFYFLSGIAGILAVVSIFLTIEAAVKGAAISSLEKQENQLTNQKQDLEANLVKALSNSELQEKSAELGFVKADQLVYINQASAVAKLP